jgi:hypothetical protein
VDRGTRGPVGEGLIRFLRSARRNSCGGGSPRP